MLKTFAVIIMVVDHMGAYFFVDDLWFRAVGRIGFPIWFFLVGYSKGRGVPVKLWGSALLLLLANFVTGMYLFPLNALFTIIFIRLLIDVIADKCLKSLWHLIAIMAVLLAVILPSYPAFEYGTLAFITALYGYFVRNKEIINNDSFVMRYMVFSFLAFVVFQQINYGFNVEQFTFMAVGTLIVRMVLFYFDSYKYPSLTKILPIPLGWFIKFCGRHTLEIYVVHLILFKILALYLGYEGYSWFDLKLIDIDKLSLNTYG